MKKFILAQHILCEDADYLVLNKPAGWATLADRVNPHNNLLAQVRQYCPTAQAVHRLDKPTSGVWLLAKHLKAYRHLCAQFAARTTNKIYHAVVQGVHTWEAHKVVLPLRTAQRTRVDVQQGKTAVTCFTTIRAYRQYTLVACQPITGRTHQIRVHAASLSAPLVGDSLYGGSPLFIATLKPRLKIAKGSIAAPLIHRAALHAFSIDFKDLKGNLRSYTAPYPKDFTALVRQLDKYSKA